MSSLEAWNNFLQEGFEILGDDFEPLKDYGEVAPTFARLTGEVLPLLTLESDLYAFVNGTTLKSWREKYIKDDARLLGIGLDHSTIDIIESNAMIMKDERAKYARLLHGFVMDAIQEESVKFEDMLFEEKRDISAREVLEETKLRLGGASVTDVLNAVALKLHIRYPTLKNKVMKDNAGEDIIKAMHNLTPKDLLFTVDHTSTEVFDKSQVEILKYVLQYEDTEEIISFIAEVLALQAETVKSILRPSAFDKNATVKYKVLNWVRQQEDKEEKKGMEKKHDHLQLEIITLKNQLLDFYPTVSSVYDTLVKRFKYGVHAIDKYTAPTKSGAAMGIKRRLVRDMKKMLKESQGTNKKEEVEPMKQQEKTVQEGINTFASNLARAVIKQLDVNELNAEIADAFTVVTNLKTSLSVAEKQLNTVKTVKDMLSKGDLTEADIVLLTQYVDSMAGN